jgi:hypothetical protein
MARSAMNKWGKAMPIVHRAFHVGGRPVSEPGRRFALGW